MMIADKGLAPQRTKNLFNTFEQSHSSSPSVVAC